MTKNGMRPIHPGEVLLEEFMKPSDPPIHANMLAKALEVPANRITAIIKGQHGITGDTAIRLAAFFNTTAEFWMNLQETYELRLAEKALPEKIKKHIEEHRNLLVSAKQGRLLQIQMISLGGPGGPEASLGSGSAPQRMSGHPLLGLTGHGKQRLNVTETERRPVAPCAGLILERPGEGRCEERSLLTEILPDRRLDVAASSVRARAGKDSRYIFFDAAPSP